MHELSIAKSVIDIVIRSLPFVFDKKVCNVHVQIGSLSGVEPDALTFAFSILSEKTQLRGAHLIIEHIQAKAICKTCTTEFYPAAYGHACPNCNGFLFDVTCGKELKVSRIQVEDI